MEAPRGTVVKSRDGIPPPVYPPGIDLAKEARTARRRFYPVTILYTTYAFVIVALALPRSVWTTLAAAGSGVVIWSGLEYAVHRYVLHGRFPAGTGWLRRQMHAFFDTMHGDHHLRPWDGMYINGFLDTVPFAVVLALGSFLAPLPTAPVLVAMLLQCYVIEEWVHYSVHFHRFKLRYFDYIRRHHLYHHSPQHGERAFGLTSGVWDAIVRTTRIPEAQRRLLYGRRARSVRPTNNPLEL
jgi:sterol desaturase/sphingolipid hydroxylase (fatty acid hydroxylase superfamily)